jgi:hypothetical protein
MSADAATNDVDEPAREAGELAGRLERAMAVARRRRHCTIALALVALGLLVTLALLGAAWTLG